MRAAATPAGWASSLRWRADPPFSGPEIGPGPVPKNQTPWRRTGSLGELSFSLNSRQVFFQGAEIPFTKSEYAICEYLALNRGQVFSKERIYEHVFGYDGEGDSSAITEHIKNIRAKLQKYGVSPVETVWGIGYKWK